jgi:hypothetical protein
MVFNIETETEIDFYIGSIVIWKGDVKSMCVFAGLFDIPVLP